MSPQVPPNPHCASHPARGLRTFVLSNRPRTTSYLCAFHPAYLLPPTSYPLCPPLGLYSHSTVHITHASQQRTSADTLHTQFATPPASWTTSSAEAWRQLRLGNTRTDAAEHSFAPTPETPDIYILRHSPALSIPAKLTSTGHFRITVKEEQLPTQGFKRSSVTYSNRELTPARRHDHLYHHNDTAFQFLVEPALESAKGEADFLWPTPLHKQTRVQQPGFAADKGFL